MAMTDLQIKATIKKATRGAAEVMVREGRGRGQGALVFRAAPSGSARWYFAHTVDRRMRMIPIGPYGDQPGEFTLEAARRECSRLDADRAKAPAGDLLLLKRVQKIESKAEARRLQAKVEAATTGTLRALVDTYVAHLERQGKANTAADVRRLAKLHVCDAFPAYASAPARELTSRQATEILRRLVNAGKGTTARKVRSYLRSAFEIARKAETDAKAPAAMLAFDIELNPVAATAALSDFNGVRDRALTELELRALWARLSATDTPSALAIRLSLLCGGQRFEQLLRARVADFSPDDATLTLLDPKGRRKVARVHVVPLPAGALAIVARRAEIARAAKLDYLFPQSTGGHLSPRTVSKFLQPVREAMVEAGEAGSAFMLANLRATCETRLAALGVSKDLRAQIQSHGLGGVQARHYDRHEYIEEKRTALEAWANWLTTTPASNVVAIAAAKAR